MPVPPKVWTQADIRERMKVAPNGCWLWQRSKRSDGAGQIIMQGRNLAAHRVAYELWHGPIPAGRHLHHTCHTYHCVNPEHLQPLTQAEHNGYHASLRTHCKHGHEFNTVNTYVRARGSRECRECHRLQERARWRRLHT